MPKRFYRNNIRLRIIPRFTHWFTQSDIKPLKSEELAVFKRNKSRQVKKKKALISYSLTRA